MLPVIVRYSPPPPNAARPRAGRGKTVSCLMSPEHLRRGVASSRATRERWMYIVTSKCSTSRWPVGGRPRRPDPTTCNTGGGVSGRREMEKAGGGGGAMGEEEVWGLELFHLRCNERRGW